LPARLERGVGLAPPTFSVGLRAHPDDSVRTVGEVFLIPDPPPGYPCHSTAAQRIFFDRRHRDSRGRALEYCPRHVLRRALDRLKAETGLKLLAAFEQEFIYSGVARTRRSPTNSMPIAGKDCSAKRCWRRCAKPAWYRIRSCPNTARNSSKSPWRRPLGCGPPMMRDYRELTQAVAFRLGSRVSFNAVARTERRSNGTHIHWSFLTRTTSRCSTTRSGRGIYPRSAANSCRCPVPLARTVRVTAPSLPSYYACDPIVGRRFRPTSACWTAARRCGSVRRSAAIEPTCPTVQYRISRRRCHGQSVSALAMMFRPARRHRHRWTIDSQPRQALPDSLENALHLLQSSESAAQWLAPMCLRPTCGSSGQRSRAWKFR